MSKSQTVSIQEKFKQQFESGVTAITTPHSENNCEKIWWFQLPWLPYLVKFTLFKARIPISHGQNRKKPNQCEPNNNIIICYNSNDNGGAGWW